MRNQFGQDINVGDWVGYTSKRGSITTRKIGIVTSFGQRSTYYNPAEIIVRVNWKRDGTWRTTRDIDENGKGVGLNTVFKLANLEP